jgi:rfaE bifunctional protein kinase chain/domain
MKAAPLLSLLERIRDRAVLVAGDFVLDHYVYGRPSRLSREAPVLILEHDGDEWTPGGAGNAARNIRSLGGRALPLGVVGADQEGERLVAALSEAGMRTDGIVIAKGRTTVAKTRVLAGGVHSAKQQVLRIDKGDRRPLPDDARAALRERLEALLPEAEAVLLSDYGYWTLFPDLRERLLAAARERGLPSCADSRFELLAFRGVEIATPNEAEAGAALGVSLERDEDVNAAGAALVRRLESRALLLTRGSRGMRLFLSGGPHDDIPVLGPDEVADVTGAGDTVASALVLGLASGADASLAARLANAAASVVVMKRGAATASPDEVARVLRAAEPPAIGPDAGGERRAPR